MTRDTTDNRRNLMKSLPCICGAFALVLVTLSHAPFSAAHAAESFSGYPVPRFVSLRGKVNVRRGPSPDQPIEWQYRRAGLPVEIIAETEEWRQIRDSEGYEGWVHKTLLKGDRHVLVVGDGSDLPVAVHTQADLAARVVMLAEPGVIGTVLSCLRDWCAVDFPNLDEGWVHKSLVWGVYQQEVID